MKKPSKIISRKFRKLKNFISKDSLSEGYVESINTEVISGWVKDNKTKFYEVRLVDDDNVLASTPINIFRDDVAKKYNLNITTGFNLSLDKIKKTENILDPKLIAINADEMYL